MQKNCEEPAFNKEKFKNLVHYICTKPSNPELLGAIRLRKILFYSDRQAYLRFGKPITGETYIKQPYGPVPNHMGPVLKELQSEQKVFTRKNDVGVNTEYVTTENSNIKDFSGEEISLVDSIANDIMYTHTPKSISNLSHDRIWHMAELGEKIPYCTVFMTSPAEVTDAVMSWACKEAKILKLV